MMNILQKIFMAMFAVATPLLWSCSDGLEFDPTAPGAMSISLYSGGGTDATTSRANEGNVEFYIGKTHLYLYTSSDEGINAVFHEVYDAGSDYSTRSLHLNLDQSEINELFGEDTSNRKCYAYVVTNLPDNLDKELTEKGKDVTISYIKNMELYNVWNEETPESFVMDGGGNVTLKDDNTMTASIQLKRAAVKVSINVYVRENLIRDGAEYTPIPEHAEIELHNAIKRGKVNNTIEPNDDDYIAEYTNEVYYNGGSVTHKESYNATPVSYYWYKANTFYTYPANWTNNNKSVNATICIPWKKTAETSTDGTNNTVTDESYSKYYYQIAIPEITITKLDRNYNYTINVYLSVLGSSLKTEYVTPSADELNFEITDWTDDGANITSSLDRNHYLVVQDNAFSLYNEDQLEIEYESCDDNVKPYVTEIKYYSTKDDKDYYIYATTYDQSTNSYTEDNGSENYTSSTLNLTTIRANANGNSKATTPMVTLSKSTSSDDSDSDNGYIVFNSAVSEIAEKLYRPVTYTIVLANSSKHGNGRQTITITQYPSKYVEFAPGCNVFVNGYFARLSPDGGSTTATEWLTWAESAQNEADKVNGTAIQHYKSYPFIVSGWNSDNGYYSSNSKENVAINFGPYNELPNTYYGDFKVINTGYEYLRGTLLGSSSLSFKNTIDVTVSAFRSSDNSFTVNSGADKYEYAIGDPRQNGSFTADTEHSSTYSRTGDEIYDYLVKCGTHRSGNTTYYDRYVQSWGEKAKQIKIGGFDKKYDKVISPLFKVQSSFGAQFWQTNFRIAQKRCATYQEAGYPAGRWRLPTLAEIAFIVSLQNKGIIDLMFSKTGTGYWTSSGGRIVADDQMTYTEGLGSYNDTSNSCYVRCVYDLWYWGSDPVTPTDVYHPLPTATTSTTKSTAKTKTTTKNVKRR